MHRRAGNGAGDGVLARCLRMARSPGFGHILRGGQFYFQFVLLAPRLPACRKRDEADSGGGEEKTA